MNKKYSTHLIIFITSFSLLFYQIALTRIFSITKWYNLVSIIITLALLGFGISGTMIAVLKRQIDKHYNLFNFVSLSLFPLSMSLSFIAYLKIPFNPYELGLDAIQIFYLLLYCFIIGIPFLIGAFIIGITIYKFTANTIYGFNMFGSGLGALAAIIALNWLHPFNLILLISILSIFSPLLQPLITSRKIKIITSLFLLIYTTLLALNFNYLTSNIISQYKPISKTLLLPKSKIESVHFSPLSVIEVVSAEGLRSVAGLSLKSPYEVPQQKMIFFDGSGSSSITPYKGNLENIKYLSYTPSALSYELINPNRQNNLLIIGVGGGEGLLKGELYGFANIEGIELNSNVVNLMKNEYSNFSGNLYSKSNLLIHSDEARGFIRSSKTKYDLIDLSMIDAYNSASSGVYAMNETYLYTVESIQDFYSKLSSGGILSISRWVNIPPKNCIKMMNICISALRNEGIENIEDHIIFIRSIQSATLLISKTPFSNSQIQNTRKFCNDRLFDIIYHKGINRSDVNRFIKLKTPVYYESVIGFLNEVDKANFTYDFDISIATDDKPYFYNFFNNRMFKDIISNGVQKVPVIDWGYLILILILIPVIICGFLFIIIPIKFINKDISISMKEALLFSLLGIGYFFVEMPLIQKFILFLSHPVYSVSIILTTLLIFSGIGSLFSTRLFGEHKRVFYCGVAISLIILLYTFLFNSLPQALFSLPFLIKVFLTILMISPLGFLMGIPFPYALSQIKKNNPDSYPWAWGINGFFSVISIIVASILAIKFGLTAVLLIASFCYLLVGIIS